MPTIAPIVEGHGEVEAVPILVRRIAAAVAPGTPVVLTHPIRIPRTRLIARGELERAVELAARLGGPEGRILVLLDADDDCPKELAATLLARARGARADRAIRVVAAKREYEGWFLAAAASLAGRRGLGPAIEGPADPEAVRDAKGWLSHRMGAGRSYRETLDQPALTGVFDLAVAGRSSPSFAKLWRDVASLLGAGPAQSSP